MFAHCFSVDTVCIHRGSYQIQRPEEFPRRLVSSLCCSLVSYRSNEVLCGRKSIAPGFGVLWKSRFFLIVLSNVCLCSIGYPVVTLGFGFKSYVSYKMRLRKQKEVQKENEFYMQLLQQALPPEQQMLQRQEREAEEGTFQWQRHLQSNN